ncbi:hypothetical protein C2869_10115 [Saccharobesus litoralis]|uniref:Glycosyl transferase family 1 domain-containing protein n=1 Tax=Saccharobesus litoralis TaxID=2172099 RepID=A0A2S0VRA9_9ALTE|nr:glycosyltransferase family 4 protein [Saccharobesus litoralis]AWB66757.1 hypothetical protein C2869_10115 [Saccharobesus litoralis]
MKIIILNYSSVFGGQERYAESLINQLHTKNVLTSFEGGPEYLKKVSLDKLPCTDILNPSARLFNGNAALYQSMTLTKGNELWVYVQHSDINDGQQASWKRWVRKALIYILLKRFDLVIRVCNKALPDCYAKGKIKTIYNGVSVPECYKSVGIQKKIKLLMVGAINANKNQKMAISVLQYLPNAELSIIGSGEIKQDLVELAETIGVNSQISWVGFVENLEPYYLNADLLLMLSHYEAFPYAVLEAMSYSVPVVTVRVGGVPEIISNNENGWLLDDYEIETLVDTLNEINNSPDSYKEVAQAARATIEKNYTVKHMTNNLIAAIEEKLNVKR